MTAKCNYCNISEIELLSEYEDIVSIGFYGEDEIPICGVCVEAESNYNDKLETERCLNNWIVRGNYCG